MQSKSNLVKLYPVVPDPDQTKLIQFEFLNYC